MNIIGVIKIQHINTIKHTYYITINYWILNVFLLELNDGDGYTLDPDGFSYIIYAKNKAVINYYKPFPKPFTVKAVSASTYYIVKCRPTYVSRLHENKIALSNFSTAKEFLTSLDSEEFKNIYPTVLESILFHMRFTRGKTSIASLKKRYQCTSIYIEVGFENLLGLSFTQYQNILLNAT